MAGKKKPGSRLIKVSCGGCEYTARITRQWIDVGLPQCPNEDCDDHGSTMEADL